MHGYRWLAWVVPVLFLGLWNMGCGGEGEGFDELSLAVSRTPSVTPNASVSPYVLVEDCEPYELPEEPDEYEEPLISEYRMDIASTPRGKSSTRGTTAIYCNGFEPVPLSLFPNPYLVKIVPEERVKGYPPGSSNPGDVLQDLLFGNPGPCPENMNACTEIDLRPLASPNFVGILAKDNDDPVEYGFSQGYTVLPLPIGMVLLPEVYPKAPEGSEELEITVQVHIWEPDLEGLADSGVSPADAAAIGRMMERILWEEKCHAVMAEEFISYVGMLIDMPPVPPGRFGTAEAAAQAVRDEYARAFNELYAEYERKDNTRFHQLLALAETGEPLEGFFDPDGNPVSVPVFGPDASGLLAEYIDLCGDLPEDESAYDDMPDSSRNDDTCYPDDYMGDEEDQDGDPFEDYDYPNPMCGSLGSAQDLCPGFVGSKPPDWDIMVDVVSDDTTAEITCIAHRSTNGHPEDVDLPPLEDNGTPPPPQSIDVILEEDAYATVVYECDWGGSLTWEFSYYLEGYESESAVAEGYSRSESRYIDENGGSELMEASLFCDLNFVRSESEYTINKDLHKTGGANGWTGTESFSIRSLNGTLTESREMEFEDGLMMREESSTAIVERTESGAIDLVDSQSQVSTYTYAYNGHLRFCTSRITSTSVRDYEPYDPAGANPGLRYVAERTETLEMESRERFELKYTLTESAVETTSMKNGTLIYMGGRQVVSNAFDYEDTQRTFYRSTNYEAFNSTNQPLWDSGRPMTLYVVSSSTVPGESGRILATWGADSDGNWVTSASCDDLIPAVDTLSGVESGLIGGSGEEHYPTDGCQDGSWW